MTLPKSVRKTGRAGGYKLARVACSGKFSVPANEPPADPTPKPDDPDSGKDPADEKKFTQADLNKLLAKEKGEGKRAAEKALADKLGVSVDQAAEIIKKHQDAEDATKSEAEKELAKATKEREAAEAEKRAAAAERHELQIERALTAEGFTGDEKKLARVRRMVTVEVGATYEDVLADVQEAKTEFPELFGSKTPEDPGKKPGRLPSSDPAGKPPAPKGGEDLYAAGAKRFEEQQKKRQGYNPLAKQNA